MMKEVCLCIKALLLWKAFIRLFSWSCIPFVIEPKNGQKIMMNSDKRQEEEA